MENVPLCQSILYHFRLRWISVILDIFSGFKSVALYFFEEEPKAVEQRVKDRLLFTGLMESYSWLFDQSEDIFIQTELDIDGLFCVLAEKPWQERKAVLLEQVGTGDRLAEIYSQIIECNQKIALLQESRMIAG